MALYLESKATFNNPSQNPKDPVVNSLYVHVPIFNAILFPEMIIRSAVPSLYYTGSLVGFNKNVENDKVFEQFVNFYFSPNLKPDTNEENTTNWFPVCQLDIKGRIP